jgi:CDP-glucose 4,6-dehydratase
VERLVHAWGGGTWEDRSDPAAPHEAGFLRLDIAKARTRMGWSPRWGIDEAVRCTAEWYRAHHSGAGPGPMRALTERQIHDYEGTAA